MAVGDPAQAIGGGVERLVPGGLAEMARRVGRVDLVVPALADPIFSDQRRGQPVRVIDIVEAEAALDAEPAFVGRAVAAVDLDNPVVLEVIGELAADAAIGADAVDGAVGDRAADPRFGDPNADHRRR